MASKMMFQKQDRAANKG